MMIMKISCNDRLKIIFRHGNETGWKEGNADEKNEEHSKEIKRLSVDSAQFF